MSAADEKRDQARIPGSLGVLRIFGVPVRLHFTFVMLAIFLVVVGLTGDGAAATTVIYIMALFGSVLLHELGHALVAKRCGIRTLDIVMFPIGGLARLERMPKAREEFWIAIAGPLVNIAIFVLAAGVLVYRDQPMKVGEIFRATDTNLVQRIAFGNLILAAFNMLPAFPMDGGRILRSLLARRRSEDEATRIAARAGRGFAIVMGLYGLIAGNFMLIFIAFFVYLGATQEGMAATGRILTQGVPVRAAMITDFRTLPHGSTIREAADLLLATSQQDFPVTHGNQVVGFLGRAGLLRAMATEGPDAYVAGSMTRDFPRVSPETDLAQVLPSMNIPGSCLLVMEGDELLGLLTSENISEFLVLRRFGLEPARI